MTTEHKPQGVSSIRHDSGMTNTPVPDEYDDMKRIVALSCAFKDCTAREAAAMLSKIEKAKLAGGPCPGYVGMLEDVRREFGV